MTVRKTEAGSSWAELSRLDPLAAVLDPADARGAKNRLIDRVHKLALSRAAGDLRGRDVLDFGSGTGRLSEWLVGHGARVEGVDATPEMVAVATARVPRARFQVGDGRTLPWPDARFDEIVTAYVLQYYLGSDGAVLRELARVLRPGGRLLAIEQATESDIGRGGSVAAYHAMFAAAGFAVDSTPIRMSDSRIQALAARSAPLSRLPLLPALIIREAVRRANVAPRDGRYVDFLFRGTKGPHG